MTDTLSDLADDVANCRLCAEEFRKTASAHEPRPVFWVSQSARILIAGQAPGARVQKSGKPFSDASGDRLRQWMGISEATFYDKSVISILPMAFCFPGYDANGSDLPPPRRCATTWHRRVLAARPAFRLTLLVGGYAQKWHIQGLRTGVTETVQDWRRYAPASFPLPHPSWRNTSWLKKNPWFEAELVPELSNAVGAALDTDAK